MSIFWLSVNMALTAETGNLKEAIGIIKAVEQKYHSANSFRADFVQQIFPPHTTTPSAEATGHFTFAKPCLMRWEYTSPDEQIVVTYPSIGWLYAVKDKEVQVFDTTEFYKSVVARAFLKSILDSFEVVEWTETPKNTNSSGQTGTVSFTLKPKGNNAQISQVEVVIQKSDMMITKIIAEDQAGTKNALIFTNQKWNDSYSPDYFTPSVPHDVTIYTDKGETISYDSLVKLFKEKKGVLDCDRESGARK
jgi:outer membrane lipoprotein-sorting protein